MTRLVGKNGTADRSFKSLTLTPNIRLPRDEAGTGLSFYCLSNTYLKRIQTIELYPGKDKGLVFPVLLSTCNHFNYWYLSFSFSYSKITQNLRNVAVEGT